MEKQEKRINRIKVSSILFTLGLLCTAYFALVMFALGSTYVFNYFWMFASGGFFMCSRHWNAIKGWPRIVKIVMMAVLVIGVTIFLLVEAFIISGTFAKPSQDADYVIVLGAKVNGHTPSERLQSRLDAAQNYLEANPKTKVIVSGGQGADEEISEALAMSEFFKKNGIEEERIIMEDKSTNTVENLTFSKEFITDKNAAVVIVSSDFHVSRAKQIANDLGYDDVSLLPDGQKGDFALIPHYYMREFFSTMNYFMGIFCNFV